MWLVSWPVTIQRLNSRTIASLDDPKISFPWLTAKHDLRNSARLKKPRMNQRVDNFVDNDKTKAKVWKKGEKL